MSTTSDFFKFARERHSIYLRRKAGVARPWTKDMILHEYKFTNVFRELDKTTEWFRWNVRDPMRGDPEVLLATVIFRWFNRIDSGEAIFRQRMITRDTPFNHFLDHGDVDVFKAALKAYCGDGPYFTGAYMIRSPTGMKKLDGMLSVVDKFNKGDWRDIAAYYLLWPDRQSLQAVWKWLKEFECQGPFHAYEVVTDLRHTCVLEHAHDIMTWGNPGPGCKRGAGRILGLGRYQTKTTKRMKQLGAPNGQVQEVMLDLLNKSKQPGHWPTDWPAWEMREVEHTLCEFDKYERLRNGHGKVKGRYHP